MVITSIQFALFVLGSLVLFMVFPKKIKWISLLISSLLFYTLADLRCLGFVLFSSGSVWCAAKCIHNNFEQENRKLEICQDKSDRREIKNVSKKKRKRILKITLFLNIGILILLKICKFMGVSFPVLGMMNGRSDVLNILMPLGISYYTFSVTGYLLDIYWKRYACEPNFFRFLTWTVYFPHIVQGPIARYGQSGMELKKQLSLKWNNFKFGTELILWGMFKKLVIADRISVFINTAYSENYFLEIGIVSFLALVLDAVQIYTDFSGYMDIVTGVSEIFGVKLEKNFNHPFFARTVPEFWRRWHMSLGSWFKDYVYYPVSVSGFCKKVSKKLKGKCPDKVLGIILTAIPVMCTWILTGLWHGTGIGYLAWGIYYGTLIILSVSFSGKIQEFWKRLSVNTENFSFRLFQHIKIFFIFMGGRFLGNTIGFHTRMVMIKSIFTDFTHGRFWNSVVYQMGVNQFNFLILIVSICILILVSVMQEKCSVRKVYEQQNYLFKVAILCIAFYVVFLFGIYGPEYDVGNFMYQQF